MKKIRIISDPQLLIGAMISVFMMTGACGWMVWIGSDPKHAANPSDIPFMQALIIGSWLAYIVAIAASAPRMCTVITLSSEHIQLKIPYKKAAVFSYKEYPYIYRGRYYHGNNFGLGRNVDYIVFSRRWMPASALNQINHLGNSQDVFKIRYSPKVYKKLCDILPSKSCFNLMAAFRDKF